MSPFFRETFVYWAICHEWAARQHHASPPQDFETLWLMEEGEVEIRFGEQKLVAQAGQILVMPSGVFRDITSLGPARWLSFGFSQRDFSAHSLGQTLPLPLQFHAEDADFRALSLILLSRWNGGRDTPFSPLELAQHAVQPRDDSGEAIWRALETAWGALLWHLLENQSATPPAHQTPFWLRKTRELALQNPSLGAAQIAREVGFSPSRFRAIFAAHTGVSPQVFLRRERLERARFLLQTGEKPVAQIAREVGFDSTSHFGAQFKAAFGQKPLEYRKNARVRLE